MDLTAVEAGLLKRLKELSRLPPDREALAVEQVPDPAEVTARSSVTHVAMESIEVNWQTVRSIRAALARIAAGTYGTCSECQEPIPQRRLKCAPEAERCVACQEQLEKSQSNRWPHLTAKCSQASYA